MADVWSFVTQAVSAALILIGSRLLVQNCSGLSTVPWLLENCGTFLEIKDSPSHWFWKGVCIYTFELLGLLACLSVQGFPIHVFKAVWLAAPARCWAKAPVPQRQGPIAPAPLADLVSMQRACFTILGGFLVALGTFSILYSSLGCRHPEGGMKERTDFSWWDFFVHLLLASLFARKLQPFW